MERRAVLSTRTIKEIKEVAYKPDEVTLGDEEVAYWVVRDPGRNLTIFPPYRLGGGEYAKTYGHLHDPPYPETYRVLLGKAGFLYQKIKDGEVVEVHLKVVNEGESFTVPAEFTGHVMLNLGDGYLIVLDDDDPVKTKHDYEPIQKTKGFGYYICDSKIEVPNPALKNLPPLQKDA